MGEKVEYKPLTREELNALAGEELPERAVMSLINANVAAPINAVTGTPTPEPSSNAASGAPRPTTP